MYYLQESRGYLASSVFYNLMIVNRSSGKGVFGQPNGTFSVYASNGDTISLSVRGYPLINVIIKANDECRHVGMYIVENKVQDVWGDCSSFENAGSDQRGATIIGIARNPHGYGNWGLAESNYGAVSSVFEKEKAKRWVAEQEHLDSQRDVLKELLRLYVAYEVIELTDEEFEEFIYFLNMDETFLKTASEMDLITFIQDKLTITSGWEWRSWMEVITMKNRDAIWNTAGNSWCG